MAKLPGETRRGRSASRALAIGLLALASCGGDDESQRPVPTPPAATDTSQREERRPDRSERGPRVETVARGLEAPWEIAFLPDGRALVTERPGRVRLLSRDLELDPEPAGEVEVAAIGEGGLLGLAVDPGFERNRFVYLYRTTDGGNEVVRYRLDGKRLAGQRVIATGLEAGAIHDGGRLRFGPDGLLYLTSGDAGQDVLAQRRSSLNGKVLRLGPRAFRGAGGRPQLVSLGHRNPQGIDWQPGSERLFASEHGPDGDDELNVIRPGRNYGWPLVRGREHGRFEAPVAVYDQTIAPSGASFVRRPGSAWSGDLLVACLVGEQIRRVSLRGSRVSGDESLFKGEFGRLRTVVEGPDGALYALTSNRDGRGTPREGDDRLLRIVPPGV